MQPPNGTMAPPACRAPTSLGAHAYLAGWVLGVTVVVFGLAGCAGFGAAPAALQYDSRTTQDLLTALDNTNADLLSAKWIGKVTMTIDGRRRTFNRAVWAGAEPGRVRFDARTPFGLPILSLACDESYVTAIAHGEGQYYRKRVGENSLGRVLPVEISCRDFYRLMTGRPPVIVYHSARLENAPEGMQTILLKRRFKGTVARLWVDAGNGVLTGVELLDIHGNRRYRAQLAQRRTVEGFTLPYDLQLESAQGKLDLEIARLYPNRPVTGALFQIPPPK